MCRFYFFDKNTIHNKYQCVIKDFTQADFLGGTELHNALYYYFYYFVHPRCASLNLTVNFR